MIWKRKKLLVFFSLLASFFLAGFFTSSTVRALELSENVNLIDATSNPTFYVKHSGVWTGVWRPFTTGSAQGNEIWVQGLGVNLPSTWGFNNKSYIEVGLSVSNFTRSGVNVDSLVSQTSAACTDFNIVDVKFSELSDQTTQIKFILRPTRSSSFYLDTVYFLSARSGCSNINFLYLWNDSTLSVNFINNYQVREPQDQSSVVNAINNSSRAEVDAINNINNQQEQAGQQAQGDGNTAGSSSQQQAQQGGQTLLQGFSSFVGALTSANATNCVINANIGEFKMGNVDLCQISPPPAFQAISSIMVIGFVVPLSIATTRKFLSLFRSFQNG